ncbi:acyltransferase family protein [Pseudonocardia sp. HH130630-07]|uniref:acyltransferase family protein n=1 Tax=Pseudonocardia sp. HH130630-07 TaxID=1690815 RepID=UPI000814F82D|nr:acyltransferase [Pseudonocardia sp. HH130630-07]ANY06946.1 hypothetical protein AFB00_12315 [Pseudonocardia sp. HH130630-07]
MDGHTPGAAGGRRVHGLDALRGGALLLGIVLHSLMPFLPGGFWVPDDVHDSTVASVAVTVIHLFRMVLFVMLAGYFGRMVLRRRGTRAYLRDRGLRILLPLVVLGPLVLASLAGVFELDRVVRGTPLPAELGGPPWLLLLAAPGHLWFLDVLVQCIVLVVGVRAVLVRTAGPERLDAWAARAGDLLAVPGAGVVVAALPYLVTVLLQGHAGGGIDQPTTVLPEPVPLVGYLGAFLVGWCLHAGTDALRRITGAWTVNLVAAVVLTAVGVFAGDAPPFVVQAVVVAVAGWTWTFGLVGACVRFLHRDRAWVRYLADASYWMYLAHLPVVMVTGVFLADLGWPVPVKLLVVWAVAAVTLLGSYDLLVRDTWIGRWLGGRRRPSVLRGTERVAS